LLQLCSVFVLRVGRSRLPSADGDRPDHHPDGPAAAAGSPRQTPGNGARVMSAILEFAELVRTFGGLRAVDGATFEVESGSITGLIGPNGAGKTTVFNCATGTLRPDSGRIVFEGGRLDRKPPHRIAREGLVRTFQTARPLTRLSVRENVMLAGIDQPGERLTGWLLHPKAARRREELLRRRADELLALVRLDSLGDAYAGTLSGGQ